MAENTIPVTYLFDGYRVEIMPYFLYEVSVCKCWKGGFCTLGSKFYKSDKLLTLKKEKDYIKRGDVAYMRCVDLLGVPKEFVEENSLPIYERNKKKLTKKKKK